MVNAVGPSRFACRDVERPSWARLARGVGEAAGELADRGSAALSLQRLQDSTDAKPREAGHQGFGRHLEPSGRAGRRAASELDFEWALNPWGESILARISWTLFWLSLIGGVLFVVAQLMLLSTHENVRDRTDNSRARPALPERIQRHSLMARLFHWSMAAAIFVLLVTAFLPVVGMKFEWITCHWIAGIVLTGRSSFTSSTRPLWLDFWSIWVGPKDRPTGRSEHDA